MEEKQTTVTPEQIQSVYQDNKNVPEELQTLKQEFLTNLPSLPENPEEHQTFIENNRDQIQEHVDQFGKNLRKNPRSVHHETFPTFDQWVQNVDVTGIRQQILDNVNKLKEKNPDKEYNVDEILSDKLKSFYYQAATLHKYQTAYGIENLDPKNPEESYNDFMNNYTSSVVDHFSQEFPETSNQGSITFVIGYSGAGKSKAIGDVNSIDNTPFQITNDNKLVLDSDNIQPYIPGFAGGVGSQNTSIYAISAHKKLMDAAMAERKDLVVPIVGGQIANVVSDIVKALFKGYDKIIIKLVNTPAHVSYHNVINRAKMQGTRVITPIVGSSSNPIGVYETLSGKSAVDDQQIANKDLSLIKDKIEKEIIKELGGVRAVKANPEEFNKRMSDFQNLDDKIEFQLVQGPQEPIYNSASIMLKTIRLAKVFESRKQYSVSDMLIELIYNY